MRMTSSTRPFARSLSRLDRMRDVRTTCSLRPLSRQAASRFMENRNYSARTRTRSSWWGPMTVEKGLYHRWTLYRPLAGVSEKSRVPTLAFTPSTILCRARASLLEASAPSQTYRQGPIALGRRLTRPFEPTRLFPLRIPRLTRT